MTSNNTFTALTYVVEVVVHNESNMASYFPEAGNWNDSNADMWLGRRLAGRSIFVVVVVVVVVFGSSSRSGTFTISPTTSTTDQTVAILDLSVTTYGYHTAFRGMLRHYA